ncbi:MAG: 1-deoxy-D-xylulose-5-phosphate reductoisomerase [Polaromonas sp.]|uniref:1-deoxy-D-xylulose-5-phosphate reductoisomerase n=1 Tax=Polaromonas sp. TaxID=1869339 RepID=UPI002730BF61|nr:1-deoxy-D-xylulose-5-phosphate reductoisomerase [Polaromonas sp.]MDP2448034.1 1-deoxy-D-xylulose-5-phosphate reductoisomerase [Polaromonas sp.]MDP3249556.1 1-deoxy-D-xylulose-5-phosphate reductoisomerase [Polaromonas sp.]MDP3757676.1 1-deoxy-D-xylulose-5-phosphate reductoisomerase [Polaromonas sp.]
MPLKKQSITVLGSTGSVGVNTLDVIAGHPDRFEVFALSAATQTDLMLAQCLRFKPSYAVMASAPHARLLAQSLKENGLSTEVLLAPDALEMIASDERVDTVMAAIVGAAGLAACMAAARAGKRLLLANKEALVVGGEVFMQAVREGGAQLLPIDSEHSAIFQSLPEDPAAWMERIDKIILTASGGPFRTRAPATLRDVTPDEACAHPNWVMGRKISVDSATMMNKALEVIEARYLFGLTPAQIEVVIHPQSIIHSMVQYRDTSVVAQLGTPDMRVPIAYGLAWPGRISSGAQALDFRALATMTFAVPDNEHFPGLPLAWEVLDAPVGTTAVLNAANEVAVAAFLEKRIRFDQIHAVNRGTLDTVNASEIRGIGDLLALDAQARAAATRLAGNLTT